MMVNRVLSRGVLYLMERGRSRPVTATQEWSLLLPREREEPRAEGVYSSLFSSWVFPLHWHKAT